MKNSGKSENKKIVQEIKKSLKNHDFSSMLKIA